MKWIRRHRWGLAGLLVGAALLAWVQYRRAQLEHSQDKVIAAAAERYGVEFALIKAVIWRESRFHPRAQGSKGEVGLMQLRENAAREWARAEKLSGFDHNQMFHPVRNIMAGAWYLHKQLQRYASTDDPVPYALAAYNAGPANVAKWRQGVATTNSAAFIRHIGFPSTQLYVQSVMRRELKYERERARPRS